MPFVSQERREKLSLGDKPEAVGDLCYLAYSRMVGMWKDSPRWTTAAMIKHCVTNGSFLIAIQDRPGGYAPFGFTDVERAIQLAWEVFFQLHVMPYELEKQRLNGDI